MSKFKVEDLPEFLKRIHESQVIWRNANWKKTLSEHNSEIEELLKKINVLSKWRNKLQSSEAAKKLFPEIFIDAFSSVHFACFGFYKYANMCLRSQLETTLRLVFFSKHPIEFQWWLDGKAIYRDIYSQANDVWGPSYIYFQKLENINKFDSLCEESKKLFGGGNGGKRIRNLYSTLSQSIHSGAGHFQSRPDRYTPDYSIKEFKRWNSRCVEVQTYINIILALTFSDEIKDMTPTARNTVLNLGIGDEYKNIIKQTLEL